MVERRASSGAIYIGYRPIGRPEAGGKGIEDRGAMKGDEWWKRCSAGVYTLVWGRLVGRWLGPEEAEVEQSKRRTQ
jgi:hypothetical protein